MAIVYTTNWAHSVLPAILKGTNPSGFVFSQIALNYAGGAVKYKSVSGSNWDSAASSAASAASLPILTTHASNNTIDRVAMHMTSQSGAMTGLTPSLTSPADLVCDRLVITAAEACNITKFSIGFAKSRTTVSVNLALRNKMLDMLTGKLTTHISADGSFKVYSGTAPDVEAAPTGTLMWQKATTTAVWGTLATSAIPLASSQVGDSEAFGSQLAVGYARFTWNFGGTDYVIQGSVGQGTGDFQFTTLESGTSMNQSTSYTLSNATIAFPTG